MELNVDNFWSYGYDVTQLSVEDHAVLWSLIHKEIWMDSVLPNQKTVSWSNNIKTKHRQQLFDKNKDEWPMRNNNIPSEYMDIVSKIWNSDYYQSYFTKYWNKKSEIVYIDLWNGTPAHEWHNHTHEGIDLVLLMYLADTTEWEYDYGGILHIGNKIIETQDVSLNNFVLPNNKTVVLINNINPKIVHSVSEQTIDLNRYTIGTGIKLWN